MKLPITAPPRMKKNPPTSSLYRSVNHWSSLIQNSQEARPEPENPGPQNKPQRSLLPHILLSRNNPSYRWPPKLLRELLRRPPPNQISLSSFPNHLRNLQEEQEDLEDPFLSEPTGSASKKRESEQRSSMLFGGASDLKEETLEGQDPQTTTMRDEEEILLTTSPMMQIYRTMSPSPRPETSSLWDPSLESSMETELEQMPSLPSTSDT